MTDEPQIGFGMTRFTYTKEQVIALCKDLDANRWDAQEGFWMAWNVHFKDRPREEATFVLDLVYRVIALKQLHGRSPERIWKAMTESGGPCNDRLRAFEEK